MGAGVLSGLCFTLLHTIALTAFLPWQRNALASLGVFIGGALWSWLYLKSRNMRAPYVSHVFADLLIVGIGYEMVVG